METGKRRGWKEKEIKWKWKVAEGGRMDRTTTEGGNMEKEISCNVAKWKRTYPESEEMET